MRPAPHSLFLPSVLSALFATLLAAEGLTPDRDKMPLDEGVKSELPDAKIR